jgi:hypothetical protein
MINFVPARAAYLLARAIACRTCPRDFFKAAAAWDGFTPAASITTATGVRFPLALRAALALS